MDTLRLHAEGRRPKPKKAKAKEAKGRKRKTRPIRLRANRRRKRRKLRTHLLRNLTKETIGLRPLIQQGNQRKLSQGTSTLKK